MLISDLVRQNIKNIRIAKGISCMEMATYLHMDERNYRRIENGERKNLDVEQLYQISEILEVDFQRFFTNPETIIHNIENNIGGISNKDVTVSGLSESAFSKMLSALEKSYKQLLSEKDKIIEEKENIIRDLKSLHQKE